MPPLRLESKNTLTVRNRQRVRAVDLRVLRRLALLLLHDLLRQEQYQVGLHLVAAPEMIRLNESFLGHAGSTDVLAFNYAEQAASPTTPLQADIFICVNEAVVQARRFRTTWQAELARYLVHGLLHLRGFDDLIPGQRRVMKREEDRLLRLLAKTGFLNGLQRRCRKSQPRRGGASPQS